MKQPTPGCSSIKEDTNRKGHDRMHPYNEKYEPQTRRRHPKQHETIRQSSLNEIFAPRKSFPKFFIIKAENQEENLSDINVIKANRELIKGLNGTKPKKVDELRDGSLLVEISNEEQSTLVTKITRLDNMRVKVTEHSYLNQTKGTIYYRNRCKYTDSEILEELASSNVANVYRTSRKIDGQQILNNIYILTFNSCHLPEDVNIGWNKCRVREYIPQPRRCFKCQGFQHSSKNCRKEEDICVNCGQESHGQICNHPPSCKNCKENHPASSRECSYYKLAQEILTIQTREKVNYRDARSRALQYMTTPENLYSNVVKNGEDTRYNAPKTRTNAVDTQAAPNATKRTYTPENTSAKKMKPHGPPPNTHGMTPPVSNKSQETVKQSSTNNSHQSGTTFAPDTPQGTTRAPAQAAAKRAYQEAIPPDRMEEDPQTDEQSSSQIIKTTRTSRSTSRNRTSKRDHLQN